ncbi:MAG: hypothetical protein ACJAUD_000021 [Crocinitomicaceae bacterium]|jgi:hypothetical protein
MLKAINLLLFLGLFYNASAKDRMASGVYLVKTELDESLGENEAVYKFVFSNINDEKKERVLLYSVDGKDGRVILSTEKSVELATTPGKHRFVFYYSQDFAEFYSDSLEIKAQHKSEYTVLMNEFIPLTPLVPDVPTQLIKEPRIVFKPVIYLYPETETTVKVEVDIKGDKPFFYPEYKDGWECVAQPNGDLKIGDDTYNYLFWEASEPDHLDGNTLTDGFYVEGQNAMAFLESKLTSAGFTSKEKADFITFWGPRIQANEHNFIRFDFNEACNKYADLKISPEPDHIYRIYIQIAPLDKKIKTDGQNIIPIDRSGFTVLEWGGQLSSLISINAPKS